MHNRKSIKVLGVGGGGSNAVTYMHSKVLEGVELAIANTDKGAMELSPVQNKILLGSTLTAGKGTFSNLEMGEKAAKESIHEIDEFLSSDTRVLIIIAGLGGGTGGGAAPIIAKRAREKGILTIGAVTVPFEFEGKKRKIKAITGLNEFKKYADTITIIQNDILREIYGNLSISEAFSKADEAFYQIVLGITKLIAYPGYVNVEIKDIVDVFTNSNTSVFSTGIGNGQERALQAVKNAFDSPFLANYSLRDSKNVLVNVLSDEKEVTMDEIFQITEYITEIVGPDKDIIWGNSLSKGLEDQIEVFLLITGFELSSNLKTVQAVEKGLEQAFSESSNDRLSLYFLEEEYSPEEIGQIISFLSDLYRSEGGDKLVIRGFEILEFESILEPNLLY